METKKIAKERKKKMSDLDENLKEVSIYTNPIIPHFETEEERFKKKIYYLETEVQQLKEKQVQLPKRYIINENACILFWKNGEKTVVKRCADDEFNPRLAFLTAFFQHYTNFSKSKANKYLANLKVEEIKNDNHTRHKKDKN